MASNRMSGSLMGLEINGTFIKCELSCEFTYETDLRSASPVDAGRWKEWVPGVRSWSINLNAAMLMRMAGTGVDVVLNAFLTGEILNVRFVPKRLDVPHLEIRGKAFVRSGGINAIANTRSTWTTTLTGHGPFSVTITTPMIWSQDGENAVESDNKLIYVTHGS